MQIMQVGIVELSNNGGYSRIGFRRPYYLLSFMGFLVILMLIIECCIMLKFKSSGIVSMLLLAVPMILIIMQFQKTYAHECSIELQDGVILCHLGDDIVKRIDIRNIQGITANEASERCVNTNYIPKRPAVLIVAEPENATIKGPRKFTDDEADFILKILNNHRHNINNDLLFPK